MPEQDKSEHEIYLSTLSKSLNKFDFNNPEVITMESAFDKIKSMYRSEEPDSGAILIPRVEMISSISKPANIFDPQSSISDLLISSGRTGNLRFGFVDKNGYNRLFKENLLYAGIQSHLDHEETDEGFKIYKFSGEEPRSIMHLNYDKSQDMFYVNRDPKHLAFVPNGNFR